MHKLLCVTSCLELVRQRCIGLYVSQMLFVHCVHGEEGTDLGVGTGSSLTDV